MSETQFDWTTATEADRQVLYTVVRGLVASGQLSMARLFSEAFDPRAGIGLDYEANFRKGTIGRARAAQIARYLNAKFPEAAAALDAQLRPGPVDAPGERWRQFLMKHRMCGKVDVISLAFSLTIVEFASTDPISGVRLRLGEPFCFSLDAPAPSSVTALQSYGGHWHRLPLARDAASVAIDVGPQFIPRSVNGDPIPLVEHDDAGLHEFVFLTVQQGLSIASDLPSSGPISAQTLDQFAERLASQIGWHLLGVNVRFSRT